MVAKKKTTKGKITKTKFFSNLKKDVPVESVFNLVNGGRISNLKQLALEIDKMPDEVFYYHVNDYKNDFSNWISDCLKDEDLSKKLSDIKDRKDFQILLLKTIVKKV